MDILITGITGFIGRALAHRFSTDGHIVSGFAATTEPVPGATSVLAGDICCVSDVDAAMARVNPEIVVHLAARTEVATSFDDPSGFVHANACGTVRVAEAARCTARRLRLFLSASSMEVYGRQPQPWAPFDEATPPCPNAPYAVAKLAAEYYLRYLGQTFDFPWAALRQTNAYGRTRSDFFVVERILSQMVAGPIIELGDPEPFRNLLYIDDLVDLYSAMLACPERAVGEIFCTGPPNALTIRALVALCAEITGWQGEVRWHRRPVRPGEVYYLNSRHDKASAAFGWSPKTEMRDGLTRTAAAWRSKSMRA